MRKLLLIFFLFVAKNYIAQDIRMAYITSFNTSPLSYSFRVILMTPSNTLVTRPTIKLGFGNGDEATVPLTTASNFGTHNLLFYNYSYTYPNAGIYNVYYVDSFRVTGIKNMSNSSTQHVQVRTQIKANNFTGTFSVLQHSKLPIDLTVNGNLVSYDAHWTNADLDSLSFSLTNCAGSNYYTPANASINSTTGELSFTKDSIGIYAFSFDVNRWRKNTANVYQVVNISQMDFTMDITPSIGLNEESKSNNVNIYPNPLKDKLKIEVGSLNLNSIRITNVLGKSILDLSPQTREVDLGHVEGGVYFLKLTTTDYERIFKIIKQ